MGKSIILRYCFVSLLALAAGMSVGCNDDIKTPTAQPAATQADDGMDTETNPGDTPDLWAPMEKMSRVIELAEECCETTGHANECWEADALDDNEHGFVLCNSDADCDGRPCYKSAAIAAALAKYPRITATGMCECNGHEDCRDTAGDGGTCFTYSDAGTGSDVNICGPSMCNGYYVCSCWGGCTWWDGNNTANTPANDAAGLGLYCCENSEYADPERESGLVAFGNESCSGSFLTADACTTAADCDLPSVNNPAWDDQCVDVVCNTGTSRCEYVLKDLGTECDLDSDICTLDICEGNGVCEYKKTRVSPDTYGAASALNTCTIDCVAAADNLSYASYETTSDGLPSDVATRATTNACYEWTCTTSGGITYPDEEPVVCVDANTGDCTIPVCDPSGAQGNCALTENVVCSGPASVCNAPACLTAAGGCTEVFDAAQENDTDDCTTLKNPYFASSRPNCVSKCESQPHSSAPAELEGACSDLYAINDSCATAIDLGDFTATNGRTEVAIKGSTACATNQHESGNTTCRELGGFRMGHGSPDVVYKFRYQPIDDGIQSLYVIKMETINGSNYDEVLYASVGEDSCVAGAIASDDCDIYSPADSNPYKPHEDRCMASKTPPLGTMDACEPVDTSGNYTAGMGRTIIAEDTSDFSGGLITVYIYVDGNSEYPSVDNFGDFYLSVTRETNTGCPPISSWYSGTVHVPGTDGVPINGSDFPGFTPNTLTGADGRTTNGVLLTGNPSAYTDSYTGESGDDPFAWNAKEEAWQLDVTAATRFTASLCDFGASVAVTDPINDPMLGLFNCHGERVVFNDNGADLPYYTEGDALCGPNNSHIAETPTLAPENSPYYLIVDGYFQWGVRGKFVGGDYDLAVYYDPFSPTDCDPNGVDGFGLIRSGSSGPYPDRAQIDISKSQCALLVNSDGADRIPGRTISFHWDGGIQPGDWQCDHGAWYYCLPLTLTMTMIYENAGGDVCTQTIVNWSDGDHGHYPPVYVPTSITTADGVTCDQFVGIATSFEYPPTLTPTQRSECELNCSQVNLKFDA